MLPENGPRPNGKVIRVVSIVDRYLEHARIFFFHHGGNHQLFIASADWMTRNLDKRVELMVPVTNGKLARRLKSILDACFRDNVQACNILPDGTSEHVVRKKGQKAFRLQQYLTKEARPPGQGQGTGTPADAGTAHAALKDARYGRLEVRKEQSPEYPVFRPPAETARVFRRVGKLLTVFCRQEWTALSSAI